MKCYRMKGTGQAMHKGNVVNLQKDTDFLQFLPAAFEELPIYFLFEWTIQMHQHIKIYDVEEML